MSKKILIDSTHSEETRVALIDEDGRLEDYDIESVARKLLKGNVFLAKVTRVEPSLQAAFVDYGGNRHGFLPFAEIHPDYYRIPIADKEAIMNEQAELLRRLEEAAEAEEDGELDPRKAAEIVKELTSDDEDEPKSNAKKGKSNTSDKNDEQAKDSDKISDGEANDADAKAEEEVTEKPKRRGRRKKADIEAEEEAKADTAKDSENTDDQKDADATNDTDGNALETANDDKDGNTKTDADDQTETSADGDQDSEDGDRKDQRRGRYRNRGRGRGRGNHNNKGRGRAAASHRSNEVRDDEDFSNPMQPLWNKIRRNYKIQEVIKRGQIMLIQINKEERGNKGAAVTSYITLPGRYCVLMPNSAQGGGVSRKISDRPDRRRMRDVLKSLEVPSGMSVILRTAGVARTKAEIKRDYIYLTRVWNSIRELTLNSTAPSQIHEEGNLLHRIIRDVYSKEYEEINVVGENGYKAARNYMKMMMPSHVKRVVEHTDETPLFIKHGIEKQIEAVNDTTVQLISGGYLVINPTEALVSIDVNSGRSTRERHIEETALKTNLEAAEEVARQMRVRDLAGLVVIDFIDMENRKNNRQVERTMQKALSKDRAKVQYGQISQFGLMELSRQRLRPSMTEKNFIECPHCHGKGIVRTIDGAALTILRAIESEGVDGVVGNITIEAPSDVILYLLNQKRRDISSLEQRYGVNVTFDMNDEMGASDYNLECQRPKQHKGHKGQQNKRTHQNKKHDHDKSDQPQNSNNNQRHQKKDPRNDAKNDDQSDQQDPQQNDHNGDASATSDKPRRGHGNRSRNNKNADHNNNSSKVDNASETGNEANVDNKVSAKPSPKKTDEENSKEPTKKPTARGRKKKTDEVSADAASTQTQESDARPAKKTEQKASPSKSGTRKSATAKKTKDENVVELEQSLETSQSGQDAPQKQETPEQKPEYNVISDPDSDGPKKKGWWSRMIEK